MRGSAVREQVVIDGVVFDLVDPAVSTPVPERGDALRDPDAAAPRRRWCPHRRR